jgi:hypothetical protein
MSLLQSWLVFERDRLFLLSLPKKEEIKRLELRGKKLGMKNFI